MEIKETVIIGFRQEFPSLYDLISGVFRNRGCAACSCAFVLERLSAARHFYLHLLPDTFL